ncbi:hypothetical protein P9112_006363 [Eukaryota sp. TZLM1-RC]
MLTLSVGPTWITGHNVSGYFAKYKSSASFFYEEEMGFWFNNSDARLNEFVKFLSSHFVEQANVNKTYLFTTDLLILAKRTAAIKNWKSLTDSVFQKWLKDDNNCLIKVFPNMDKSQYELDLEKHRLKIARAISIDSLQQLHPNLALSTQGWVLFKTLYENNKLNDLSVVPAAVLKFRLLKDLSENTAKTKTEEQIIQFIGKKRIQLKEDLANYEKVLSKKIDIEIGEFIRFLLVSPPCPTDLSKDAEKLFNCAANVTDPHMF